jgi:hypothetical protein
MDEINGIKISSSLEYNIYKIFDTVLLINIDGINIYNRKVLL